MSDDIVSRLKSPEVFISIGGMTSLVAHEAADHIEAQAAEIARLRAERNAETSARMKAEGEFSTMQRRIARQRRVLTKLYQRRHDKNAALATARREGMEEAAQIVVNAKDAIPWGTVEMGCERIAAEIRAAAKEGK